MGATPSGEALSSTELRKLFATWFQAADEGQLSLANNLTANRLRLNNRRGRRSEPEPYRFRSFKRVGCIYACCFQACFPRISMCVCEPIVPGHIPELPINNINDMTIGIFARRSDKGAMCGRCVRIACLSHMA